MRRFREVGNPERRIERLDVNEKLTVNINMLISKYLEREVKKTLSEIAEDEIDSLPDFAEIDEGV